MTPSRRSSHRVSTDRRMVVETATLFALLNHLGLELWKSRVRVNHPGLVFFKKKQPILMLPLLGKHVPWAKVQSIGDQLNHLGLMSEAAFEVWLFRHQKEKKLTAALKEELKYGITLKKDREKVFDRLVKKGELPTPKGELKER